MNNSTDINKFRPSRKRNPTQEEINLLHLSLGKRRCSNSILDNIIDLYLIAVTGTLLFILLSLEVIDKLLTNYIKQYWGRVAFKAILIFIVLYLVDRWLKNRREDIKICVTDI